MAQSSNSTNAVENNIVSFARIRPFNSKDKTITSCLTVINDEVLARPSDHDDQPKKFKFSKVFDMNVSQKQFYETAISPILTDILNGYNCTVFAYGQTNSGKTHTMIGAIEKPNSLEAGIVQRALTELFQMVTNRNCETTISVSYMEIYNEGLTDLLSTEKKPLRVYEDPKNKNNIEVLNLTKNIVKSSNEAFRVLKAGVNRRHTSSTLANDKSSRSHAIFTIYVLMKTCSKTSEGFKLGKLHLVDLAGSENAKQLESMQSRVRESKDINKSLLTLGRVIRSLLEKSAHVPYRESKLTRILQDSLGGNCKTFFVATVSPNPKSYYESVNTLGYASRAQAIVSKPETNEMIQTISQIRLMQTRIESLQEELAEAQSRNGLYIAHENYYTIINEDEENKKKLLEYVAQCAGLEAEMFQLDANVEDLQSLNSYKMNELHEMKSTLEKCKINLEALKKANFIQEDIIDKYFEAQTQLKEHTTALSNELDLYIQRHNILRNKVDTLYEAVNINKSKLKQFSEKQILANDQCDKQIDILAEDCISSIKIANSDTNKSCSQLLNMSEEYNGEMARLCSTIKEDNGKLEAWIETHQSQHAELVEEISDNIVRKMERALDSIDDKETKFSEEHFKLADENVSSCSYEFEALSDIVNQEGAILIHNTETASKNNTSGFEGRMKEILSKTTGELSRQKGNNIDKSREFKDNLLEAIEYYQQQMTSFDEQINNKWKQSMQRFSRGLEDYKRNVRDGYQKRMTEFSKSTEQMNESFSKNIDDISNSLRSVRETTQDSFQCILTEMETSIHEMESNNLRCVDLSRAKYEEMKEDGEKLVQQTEIKHDELTNKLEEVGELMDKLGKEALKMESDFEEELQKFKRMNMYY